MKPKVKTISIIQLLCRELRERKIRHAIIIENALLHQNGTLIDQMDLELRYQKLFSDRVYSDNLIVALIPHRHIQPFIPILEEIARKVDMDERNENRI